MCPLRRSQCHVPTPAAATASRTCSSLTWRASSARRRSAVSRERRRPKQEAEGRRRSQDDDELRPPHARCRAGGAPGEQILLRCTQLDHQACHLGHEEDSPRQGRLDLPVAVGGVGAEMVERLDGVGDFGERGALEGSHPGRLDGVVGREFGQLGEVPFQGLAGGSMVLDQSLVATREHEAAPAALGAQEIGGYAVQALEDLVAVSHPLDRRHRVHEAAVREPPHGEEDREAQREAQLPHWR